MVDDGIMIQRRPNDVASHLFGANHQSHGKIRGQVILYPYNIDEAPKDDMPDGYEIGPGDKIIMNKETAAIDRKTDINGNTAAWKTEKLSFNQTNLDDVFCTLERVYDIEITTKNTDIYSCKLTSDFFYQDIDSIMEILEAINLGLESLEYTIVGIT